MKDLRIAFMGTPDFAVTILKSLIESNFNVVCVVTVADKPAGRGQKVMESSVKRYAKSKNLPILQPTNLKKESFYQNLKSFDANLQIVVAFRMLPKTIWQLPKYGTFNLHASLLPDYRGAAPIHWAIINGETKTGVTTFFIDDKIDTGNIILQEKTNIKSIENVGDLHEKLMHLGADLVIKTIQKIQKEKIITTKQPENTDKIAPKLTPQNCKIDWAKPINEIYNKIRGLNPYPAAWTTILNNKEQIHAKIYDVSKEKTTHNFKIGKLIATKNNLKVAVNEGFIDINSIKIAGKRKMDTKSLLNGFHFYENSFLK